MSDNARSQAVPDEGAASPRLEDVLAAHSERDPDNAPHTECECGWSSGDGYRKDTHAAHVAEVWREACTIRTAQKLDALPPESIVKTEGGTVACRFYDGVHGVVFGDDRPFKWPTAMVSELPALLLWHPDWATS